MFPRFLSIECASELCSVALVQGSDIQFREKLAPREHAYLILPFIEALLQEAKLNFADLDTIYFGRGPGAFTGLRVAAAMAQGLALSHGLEIKTVCSLGNLAWHAPARFSFREGEHLLAVLDARMEELYWAEYVFRNGRLLAIGEPRLGAVNNLLAMQSQAAFFIGTGCRHLSDVLNENTCLNYATLMQDAEVFPHAKNILKQLEVMPAESSLSPLYLRNDVAAKARLA